MGQKTVLYEIHQAENGRIVDFAGWEMPLQYESITAEHKAVRAACGIFDVSHMGRFFLNGPGAGPTLDRLVISRLMDMTPGQTRYTAVCNPRGGTKDDVLVTYLEPESYLVVVNASNREKLWKWFNEHLLPETEIQDRTFETGMVAIQGPESARIVGMIFRHSVDDIGYYKTRSMGSGVFLSRTGYTGEDGFEIIADGKRIRDYWRQARNNGAVAVGLGARDSLRLEMGYALYGHELTEEISPLEAGLQWVTHLDKGDFIGRDALLAQKEAGLERRRVGLIVNGAGIPRQGCVLFQGDQPVGEVTSGGFSPILSKGIALGFVKSDSTLDLFSVEIRGKQIPVEKKNPPFVPKKVKQ